MCSAAAGATGTPAPKRGEGASRRPRHRRAPPPPCLPPLADVLQAVDHYYIVKLRYAWQTDDKLYVVVDYCPGGELFFWLRKHQTFSESRVKLYGAELALALAHLHEMDVVYRDLKPENILLDADGHIQLADFGLSKEDVTSFTPGEGATHTFCGTPEYIAPEVLLQQEGHGKAVDWWSLGTLMYEMLSGLPPFYDENIETMYKKIMTETLTFPDHFSPEACDLLKGMLTRDPAKRLGSVRGAEDVLRHPFFADLDVEGVMLREVAPEFVPPTKKAGVGNFDKEFTSEAPVDSLAGHQLSSTAVERANIEGFTFVGDSHMGHK